jgi:hypothetical protein
MMDEAMAAVVEMAGRLGAVVDRRDVIQAANTLVVRLSEDLVGRVVVDRSGPRQGLGWFERETAIARHLATCGAPVIPLHGEIDPGPHEHHGFAVNFWKYVQSVDASADPVEIGAALAACHGHLVGYEGGLEPLAILRETLELMKSRAGAGDFAEGERQLLRRHLERALEELADAPSQALHGDAHAGNLLHGKDGVLWTDWEDAFVGPVEWDLASILWNPRFLDGNDAEVEAIRRGYGPCHEERLELCFTARAAVMSAWYPVLYPDADPVRREKLRMRMRWLEGR